MEKTILLGSTGTMSPKASKYLFIGLGLLYVVLSVPMLLEDGISVLSVMWMLTGLYLMVYAILTFSVTPITPKVDISEKTISFRKSPFGRSQTIDWSEVKSIALAPYQITFHQAEETITFSYKVNSATSIEIKSSIRAVAENLNIEVTGG